VALGGGLSAVGSRPGVGISLGVAVCRKAGGLGFWGRPLGIDRLPKAGGRGFGCKPRGGRLPLGWRPCVWGVSLYGVGGECPATPEGWRGIRLVMEISGYGAGGYYPHISKLRKARAGQLRPAAARRRPADSLTDRRCGKCPNQPTESMKNNKPHTGRQLSITSILSKRACARLGRRPSRQNATLCFAAASPVLPAPTIIFTMTVL